MINFTNYPHLKKTYGGANGNKLSILYKNSIYMIKFPSKAKNNKTLTYTNGCVSEYLGCHIFNMLGIKAQETILGEYTFNNKKKLVVACKDFTNTNTVFQDFASVKNQIIESLSNGYGVELNDVIEAINLQKMVDSKKLLEHFWNIFVVDAFLGNWDRHNGNWGFLYNVKTDNVKLAPVFDLGSSLYPQMDESLIKKILHSKVELEARVFEFPTSSLMINGKRINYYHFIFTHMNRDCDKAILRIVPRINMTKITKLIDSITVISKNHKTVLKKLLFARKKYILDFAYKDLIN